MGGPSERPCVPVEVEMLPLHRSPPGTGRLRRELKRRARAERRAGAEKSAPDVSVLGRMSAVAQGLRRRG